MSQRKTTFFYVLLIAVASLAVGMVIASRLDLSPPSSAQDLAVPALNSAPLAGALDAGTFRNIARNASPMVVNIRTESRRRAQELTDLFGGDDLFRRFFGQPEPSPRQRPREQVLFAAGTGFIISKDGFILTNNHVVEGTTKINVSLYGNVEKEYEAKIIGRDPLTDSALIKMTELPKEPLAESKFGDSAIMKPGDWVMAIGNPFGNNHSVSVGVISASERPFEVSPQRWQDVLQTDAAINPGNSGGPLLNIRGEVVGINTAIISDQRAANIGIGFAIPINAVRGVLAELRTGKVTRGRIGVGVNPVPSDAAALEQFGLKERRGALVIQVDPNGPSANVLEPGDVIVEYNGRPVTTHQELVSMVVATRPGTTVPVKILRDKQEKSVSIKVEELDLEAETGRTREEPEEETGASDFGLELQTLTPDIARQLRVPSGTQGAVVRDVDPSGPARGIVQRGDVILRVNRQPVDSAADAARRLRAVPKGGTAFLLVWRRGQELFLTVRKE